MQYLVVLSKRGGGWPVLVVLPVDLLLLPDVPRIPIARVLALVGRQRGGGVPSVTIPPIPPAAT